MIYSFKDNCTSHKQIVNSSIKMISPLILSHSLLTCFQKYSCKFNCLKIPPTQVVVIFICVLNAKCRNINWNYKTYLAYIALLMSIKMIKSKRHVVMILIQGSITAFLIIILTKKFKCTA